jgi:hypothetical protein
VALKPVQWDYAYIYRALQLSNNFEIIFTSFRILPIATGPILTKILLIESISWTVVPNYMTLLYNSVVVDT